MKKSPLVGISTLMLALLTVSVGISNAWGDAGDDALTAFIFLNNSRALQLARPAAQEGNFLAQFTLGKIYYQDGDLQNKTEAVKWFRQALAQAQPAAAKGDPRAQYVLGAMYSGAGRVLPKDSAKSITWYRKAAEQGYARAQATLGDMYLSGNGTRKDYGQALIWLRKAAEQGDAYAQDDLGLMYSDGDGVSQDDRQSVAWYRKAAEQGYPLAQLSLGRKYQAGDVISKDDKQAVAWIRKAAEQGLDIAQYQLGLIYQEGDIVNRDEDKAMSWFQKAAAQNFDPGPLAVFNPSPLWTKAYAERLEQRRQQGASAPKMFHSDVDKPGYTSPENPNNYAVIIGIEKYASLPAAEFAERDAEAVRAHLTALGYPARNIYFLSGHQATRAKIAQSVNTWLPKRVGENSTVFFYYSGHGAPELQSTQAYLVPIDGDAEDLDSTAYPIKQLYAKLGKLKARHVIVALDSCFSGAGGRSVLAKGTRPLVSKIDLGGVPDNVIALTASEERQISGTIEDQGHGAFTYYMLKGLGGAAKNGSGAVTVQSLYDYLTPKVQDAARLHNRDQTPQLLPAGSDRAGTRLR